jgi:hypothetical protein
VIAIKQKDLNMISQLIRYFRACGSYHDFLDRELLLTRKILVQGFLVVKLTLSLRMCTVAIMTWLTVVYGDSSSPICGGLCGGW